MRRRDTEEGELPRCPSFSIYSSGNTVGTAAVTRQSDSNDQFQFVSRESAGEIFPVFDGDFMSDNYGNRSSARVSLGELFNQKRDQNRDPDTSSSSDEEGEEEESVPQATFGDWAPRSGVKYLGGCKNRNSTGSSLLKPKKWRVRELLRWSRCDVKEWFVAMMGKRSEGREKGAEKNGEKKKEKGVAAKKKTKQEQKEWEKRRSYLPYRQDIFGFPGNVNRSSFARG